jgi:hypothetical protein
MSTRRSRSSRPSHDALCLRVPVPGDHPLKKAITGPDESVMGITGYIGGVKRIIVVVGVFCTVGCATTYVPVARREPTPGEVRQTEARATEIALARMSYSSDLETARVARLMVAGRARN